MFLTLSVIFIGRCISEHFAARNLLICISLVGSVYGTFGWGVRPENVLDTPNTCDKIELENTFNWADEEISSVYVCENGYMSLGDTEPEILSSSSDLSSLNTTIIAPALIENVFVPGGGSPYYSVYYDYPEKKTQIRL